MKSKKLLTILGMTALAVGVFTGCSSGETQTQEETVAESTEVTTAEEGTETEESNEVEEVDETEPEEVAEGLDVIDGTYRVEYDAENAEGWLTFLEITIADGKIETAVFDQINASGEFNTEDDEIANTLVGALIETQDPMLIEEVADHPELSLEFKDLATQLLDQAATGNTDTLIITQPSE